MRSAKPFFHVHAAGGQRTVRRQAPLDRRWSPLPGRGGGFARPQLPAEPESHQRCGSGGEDIRCRLCVEDPAEPPEGWENQDHRHKAEPLSAGAQNAPLHGPSHGEEQEGVHRIKPEEGKRQAAGPQSGSAGAYHPGVPPGKEGHDLGGKKGRCQSEEHTEHGGPEDSGPDGLPQAGELPRPIAESGHRLEPLQKAEDRQGAHGQDFRHRPHGGKGGSAVHLRRAVGHPDGEAGQQLEEQGGDPDL